jgi:hypothetical protein
MEFTREEVMNAIETLDGLQPADYRDILDLGPDGTEEYTIRGDDLGSMIHAIDVLKTYFGIVGDIKQGPVASPRRTVLN